MGKNLIIVVLLIMVIVMFFMVRGYQAMNKQLATELTALANKQ